MKMIFNASLNVGLPKKMVKLIWVLLLITQSFNAQTIKNISSPTALTAAFSATLNPGDIVVLADGTYATGPSGGMKINGVGTAANPIIFRPATPGGVTFTGGQTMDIGGEWCIVEGFRWKGGVGASNFIEFRDGTNLGNNSILKNCVVDGLTTSNGVNPFNGVSTKHNWVVLYGTNNTVMNCSFLNKITSGNMILAEYQYNASPDGSGTPNTRCDVVGHKILNNYFYNYLKIDPTATNAGDSETIRIGTSEYQNVQSNALVQNNYFYKADGENEIITNKSKGNSFINNTFRACRGSLVLRHGSHSTVNGNYFLGENVEGTGGIRIVDSYQTVTNNYIQDCITTTDNAIWNNGITFLGGNDTSAVMCSSTSMTSGYQKVTNLNLSNNTIVNTNAPLFFNINTGTTKPLGTVSNNLIYFDAGNSNITPVITGNTTSPIAMGTSLSYSGNLYKGTTLGETTYSGFNLESVITATPTGEIFTFNGTNGEGADMGTYTPITNAMVGYGIGACFVDYQGLSITNGTCNVVIPQSLTVGSLPNYSHSGGSQNVAVTANVSWTAVSNDVWIAISPNAGNGDATVAVTVTENTSSSSRTGTVTFSQVPGGDNIVRTLTVTQDAPPPPDPRAGLNLINKTASDAAVNYFSNEEVNGTTKFNYAVNSLDKSFSTYWAGDRTQHPSNRAIIIYDLKGAFDLELVDIATSGGKTYQLQIWVSSSGTADEDFSNPFPAGDLISSNASSSTFTSFVLPATAVGTKYVKIIGNGQTNNSNFTSIHEIEFYGNQSTLSVNEYEKGVHIKIYPNPVDNLLFIEDPNLEIYKVIIFSLDGKKVVEKMVNSNSSTKIVEEMDLLRKGTYIVKLVDDTAHNILTKLILKR